MFCEFVLFLIVWLLQYFYQFFQQGFASIFCKVFLMLDILIRRRLVQFNSQNISELNDHPGHFDIFLTRNLLLSEWSERDAIKLLEEFYTIFNIMYIVSTIKSPFLWPMLYLYRVNWNMKWKSTYGSPVFFLYVIIVFFLDFLL